MREEQHRHGPGSCCCLPRRAQRQSADCRLDAGPSHSKVSQSVAADKQSDCYN